MISNWKPLNYVSAFLSLSLGPRTTKWQPFFILLIHGNILSQDKPLWNDASSIFQRLSEVKTIEM